MSSLALPTDIKTAAGQMAGSHFRREKVCSVLTHQGQLPGPLLGCDDLQRWGYGLNANDRLVGVICSWHSQLKVSAHQKFGGHILQLQGCEL